MGRATRCTGAIWREGRRGRQEDLPSPHPLAASCSPATPNPTTLSNVWSPSTTPPCRASNRTPTIVPTTPALMTNRTNFCGLSWSSPTSYAARLLACSSSSSLRLAVLVPASRRVREANVLLQNACAAQEQGGGAARGSTAQGGVEETEQAGRRRLLWGQRGRGTVRRSSKHRCSISPLKSAIAAHVANKSHPKPLEEKKIKKSKELKKETHVSRCSRKKTFAHCGSPPAHVARTSDSARFCTRAWPTSVDKEAAARWFRWCRRRTGAG
jgi:hypothetical protein